MSTALRKPFLVGVLAALGCTLPGLALNRWEASLPDEVRMIPALMHLRSALIVLPLLSFAAAAWALARGARPAVRALPTGRRVALLVGLAAMQVALVGAGVYGQAVTQKDWLFPAPLPFASLPSPDGRRTAYATQSCFIGCRVELHMRDGHALVMRRARVYDQSRGERARIVWTGGGAADVEVLGLTAAPGLGSLLGGWN